MSLKIQQELSKEEVLEGYLNTIYFGRGAYGIEAASEAYFDHPAKDLNLRESAVLATVLNNPSKYDPANGKEAKDDLKGRYAYVLDSMAEMETITARAARQGAEEAAEVPQDRGAEPVRRPAGPHARAGQAGDPRPRHRHRGGDRRRWPADHHHLRPEGDGRRRGGRRRAAPRRRHARPGRQQGPAHRRRHRRHRDRRAARLLRRPGLPRVPDQLGGRRRHGRLDDEGRHRRRRHPRRLLAQRHLRGQQPHRHRRHRVREPGRHRLRLGRLDDHRHRELHQHRLRRHGRLDGRRSRRRSSRPPRTWASPATRRSGGASRAGPIDFQENVGVTLGTAQVSPINMANAYATLANGGVRNEVHVVQKVVDQNGETLYEAKDAQQGDGRPRHHRRRDLRPAAGRRVRVGHRGAGPRPSRGRQDRHRHQRRRRASPRRGSSASPRRSPPP